MSYFILEFQLATLSWGEKKKGNMKIDAHSVLKADLNLFIYLFQS